LLIIDFLSKKKLAENQAVDYQLFKENDNTVFLQADLD